MLMIVGFFPLASHLLILIYVKPYKNAVLNIIYRVKKVQILAISFSVEGLSRRMWTLPTIFHANKNQIQVVPFSIEAMARRRSTLRSIFNA
uniref:Uncharacterized protein n=1 Tax=Acrobeloides nanus TaxID=290746 RepID=A0A914DW82_9BILA